MTVLRMGCNSPNVHLGKGLGEQGGQKSVGGGRGGQKKSNCLYILLWYPFTSVHVKPGLFFSFLIIFIFYFSTVLKRENYC